MRRNLALVARLLGESRDAISIRSGPLALALCSLVAINGGCSEAAATVHRVPQEPLLIRLTGDRMEWHVGYPGRDGCLGTADDILSKQDLHLPAARPVKILLSSRDLLYTLAIPRHRIHEIAVPEVEFVLNLPPDRPGEYRFQGDQMCGFQHDVLFGRIIVHRPPEFDAWVKSHSPR